MTRFSCVVNTMAVNNYAVIAYPGFSNRRAKGLILRNPYSTFAMKSLSLEVV